jgi:tetraacyldisaccharide 4'-kinase
LGNKPVFHARHVPYISEIISGMVHKKGKENHAVSVKDVQNLEGKSVLAFSGIARNDRFKNMLVDIGCNLTGFLSFRDHWPYTRNDIEKIQQSAVDRKAECIISTEKDFCRIKMATAWPLDLVVMGIEIKFEDSAFKHYIEGRLRLLTQARLRAKRQSIPKS